MSDNRLLIMEAALKLFASRGYDAVGVQEIIDSVGITKPTLYHYFGSKQGLLDEILKEDFEKLIAAIKTASRYNGDVTTALRATVSGFFEFAREHPVFYRMQLAMWFAPPESHAHISDIHYNEQLYRILEDLFLRAAKDHGNMKGRHKGYAATFMGMINIYIGLSINGRVKLNDELVNKAIHQYMHGIFS